MKNIYIKIAENLEELAKEYRELAVAGKTEYAGESPGSTVTKVSFDDVRKVLATKIDEGKKDEVRNLLLKYDSGRLSGVDPKRFPEFIKDAEAL